MHAQRQMPLAQQLVPFYNFPIPLSTGLYSSMPSAPINSRSSSPSSFSTLPAAQTSTQDAAPSPAESESSDHGPYGLVDISTMDEMKDTKKRRRTTPQELATLENNFQQNPLPDLQLRQTIAKKLNMTPRAVQIWFQNRRQKEKKLPVSDRVLVKLPCPSEYSKYSLRDLPPFSDVVPSRPAYTVPAGLIPQAPSSRVQADSLQLPSIATLTVNRPSIARANSAPASTSSLFPFPAHNSRPVPAKGPAEAPLATPARPSMRRQTSQPYSTNANGQACLPPLNLADQHSPKSAGPFGRPAPLKRAHSVFTYSHISRPSFDDEDEFPSPGKVNEHSPGSDATTALVRKRQKLMQEASFSQLNTSTSPFLYAMSSSPSSGGLSKECGKLSLGFLLKAACEVGSSEKAEEMEVSTDDEVLFDARKKGGRGDESFSSIDSADEADESHNEAALLLGLMSGRWNQM